jgi:GTPase
VHALLIVERDSQKGIVIGRGGETLKTIGSRAREEMELVLGTKVFLDLHVKVLKEWQRDPRALERLGF